MHLERPGDAARETLLRALGLLDSPREPAFDALVRVASRVCGCPIALISLVDVDRQWFKACVGLEVAETPRSQAFCAYAVEQTDLFEVPDASADPRFAANPLVVGEPHIRFYAGQPIVFDGVALGTICAIDRVPRRLNADQRATLADLALAASALLRVRLQDRRLAETHEALAINERHLRSIADHMPALVAYIDRDERYRFVNAHIGRVFGGDQTLMLGRTVEEVRADVYPLIAPHIRRALAGETASFESSGPLHGEVRHFHADYVPDVAADGTVRGFYAMTYDITERRRAELELADSERRLLDICNNIPAVIGHFDREQRCLFANDIGLKVHGLDRSDMARLTFGSHIDARLYEQHVPAIRDALAGKRGTVHGHREVDGKPVWFKAHLIPDRGDDGTQRGFYVMTFDVTSLKEAELAKAESERRLRAITDHLPVLVLHLDSDQRVTYVNNAFRTSTGKDDDALLGRPFAEVIGPELHAQRSEHLRRCLAGERVAFDVESAIQGSVRHLQTTYLPQVRLDGSIAGMTALGIDVTELKLAERRLMQLAHFDHLTALPNRLRFQSELEDVFERPERPGRSTAVMFLDVDHFKNVNDTHGHGIGDALLQAFARRIQDSVRTTDLVARLAGDEFVVILRDVAGIDETRRIARKVVEQVGQPFVAKGRTLHVTTSVGVAVRDETTVDASAFLARADEALYRAKEAGRNTYRMAA